MPRILHLIDDIAPEELRLALQPILSRLSSLRWQQFVAVMSGPRSLFSFLRPQTVHRIPRRLELHFLSGPSIKRCIRRHRVDLIHAWSLDTAYAAILASEGGLPVLVSMWDPHLPKVAAKKALILNRHANVGVLCHAEMVKRRLVERGVEIERCVIVRPGVDFSVINELTRNGRLKETLQIKSDRVVVLLPSPPSELGGHRLGLWSAEISRHLMPELLLLIPGVSPEQRKLVRYPVALADPAFVRATQDHHSFEELLSIADLLLVPALGDISTTPIAWAMAASVPILGCAIPCITEFIAEGHNGYLVKANEPMAMAGKLIKAIQETDRNRALRDTARAQAFEAFGLTRNVEQTQHAYENLLAGRPASEGIADSALDI